MGLQGSFYSNLTNVPISVGTSFLNWSSFTASNLVLFLQTNYVWPLTQNTTTVAVEQQMADNFTPSGAATGKEVFQYRALWYREGPFSHHSIVPLNSDTNIGRVAKTVDFQYGDWEGVMRFLSQKNLKDFENTSIPLTAEELLFLSYISRLGGEFPISVANYNRIWQWLFQKTRNSILDIVLTLSDLQNTPTGTEDEVGYF